MFPLKTTIRPALLIWVFLSLVGSGCSPTPVLETLAPTVPGAITPYWTRTPSSRVTSTVVPARTPTSLPTPTPTPMTHQVIQGETMLGIALRYGISLEELMAANPEVDPRFLSIDTELVIPLGESAPPAFVMPTPISVDLGELTCYPTGDSGAWCFWLVINERSRHLENLSARIVLYSTGGDAVGEAMAIPPLNLVPGESSLPLVAFFPPPVPREIHPQGELLTALLVRRNDERYLDAEVEIEEVEIDPEGGRATVLGQVSLPGNSDPASLIWVAAVAYGDAGRVIGIRKWEASFTPTTTPTVLPGGATPLPAATSTGQTPSPEPDSPASQGEVIQPTGSGPVYTLERPLGAGESLPFEVEVYSLGPPIEEVDVLVEARP